MASLLAVAEQEHGGVVVEWSAGVRDEVAAQCGERGLRVVVLQEEGAVGQGVEAAVVVAGLDDVVGVQQDLVAGPEGYRARPGSLDLQYGVAQRRRVDVR